MAVGKNRYVDTREAAEIIGVTRIRVLQMLGTGELRGEKLNQRAWIIERRDAERMAKKEYTTGRPRSRTAG